MNKSFLKLLVVAAAICVITPDNAHAYLDAGTGSMILQVILGGIAGAVVVVKMYWRRVVGIFRKS